MPFAQSTARVMRSSPITRTKKTRQMSRPRYGDNIYALGAIVDATLKAAGWNRENREAILEEISAAQSYKAAVAICRQYITIAGEE